MKMVTTPTFASEIAWHTAVPPLFPTRRASAASAILSHGRPGSGSATFRGALPHLCRSRWRSFAFATFVGLAATCPAQRPADDTTLVAPSQPPAWYTDAVKAISAADDRRVAATVARRIEELATVLSAALRYQHSTGVVDTRRSLLDRVSSGRVKYREMTYTERSFVPLSHDVVLMCGRMRIRATSGERELDDELSYLAVWSREDGEWRFRAWQSAKIAP